MKQVIRIGTEEFTVEKETILTKQDFIDGNYHQGRTLQDCYAKPSGIKKVIYEYWKNWSIENKAEYFSVASYNGFMFTLNGVIKIGQKDYVYMITKSYNKLYELVSD